MFAFNLIHSWWFDGQSGKETPGLISNPAVKLTCVILGTMVREPMGRLPS